MEIFQIAGLSLVLCCMSLLLKKENGAFSFLLLLGGVLTIAYMIFPWLDPLLGWIKELSGSVTGGALGYLFKALGIAFITQLAQELCKDAGAGALASMVELGGRALILMVVFPVLQGVLYQVGGLLG